MKPIKFFSNKAVYALIIIFLMFQIYYVSKGQNMIWDSSVYLGNGKFIYSEGKNGFYEIIRPIGLPLVLGLVWKLHLPIPLIPILISIFFSVLYLIMTYLLAREWGTQVALVTGILLLLTPFFMAYSYFVLTEIPSMALALMAVYSWIKKRNSWLAGALCGIAFLFRFPTGLMLPVILLFIFFDASSWKQRFKEFIKVGVAFSVVIFPYILFLDTINWNILEVLTLAGSHQSNPAEQVRGIENIVFYPLRIIGNNPLLALALLGVYAIFHNRRQILKGIGDWRYYLIPIGIFTGYYTYIPNKQLRFGLALLPFLAIITAYGITNFKQVCKEGSGKYGWGIVITALLVITIVTYPQKITIPYSYQPLGDHLRAAMNTIDATEPLFSTTPLATLFIDNPLIVVYNETKIINYDDIEESLAYFNQSNLTLMIFTQSSFWCALEDTECKEIKKNVPDRLTKEYTLIFEHQYFGEQWYVLKKGEYNKKGN